MGDAGAKVLRGLLDVFVLASLEEAPKHGYALLREMAEAFGTEPNRNRLYPLLGRMVRDALIVERSEPDGARTLYQLTDAGRDAIDAYRRLPPAFRQRLARVWAPVAAPLAPAPPAPANASARLVPVQERAPTHAATPLPDGALPYPCPDARVNVTRAPRTGEMAISLTGCPMGAYDYCPLCPVAKAVDGLRRLTFL